MRTFPNERLEKAWFEFKKTGNLSSAYEMVVCFNELENIETNENNNSQELEMGM